MTINEFSFRYFYFFGNEYAFIKQIQRLLQHVILLDSNINLRDVHQILKTK